MRATGKMLGVHRDTNIAQEGKDWLSRGKTDHDPYSAMFWIVIAVGAQSCPDDKDEMAEAYFRRGNSILTTSNMDHANTTSIQAYADHLLYASCLQTACRYLSAQFCGSRRKRDRPTCLR